MTKKATENMRNTIYDRGLYWCTQCQIRVKEEDTYKSTTGLGGTVKHTKCGKSVRTRRRYRRGETRPVIANVLEVDK